MITDVERILLELDAAAAARVRAGLSPTDGRLLASVMRAVDKENTRLMAEVRVRHEVTEAQGERIEKLEAEIRRLDVANADLRTRTESPGLEGALELLENMLDNPEIAAEIGGPIATAIHRLEELRAAEEDG